MRIEDLIERYKIQFSWLKELRHFIYRKVSMVKAKTIVDIGTGMGYVLDELRCRTSANLIGVDISREIISHARIEFPYIKFFNVDAHEFDYSKADIVLFSFSLMWIKDVRKLIKKIRRQLKEEAKIVILAEPDYGGRIEYPLDVNWTPYIVDKLRSEGANPYIARELYDIFRSSGFKIELRVAGTVWNDNLKDFEQEWIYLSKFLKADNIETLINKERKYVKKGIRSLFTPIFYGWAYF